MHTHTIELSGKEKEFEIRFKAEQKCIKDNLCLKTRRQQSCEVIDFCLEEPNIKLYQPNISVQTSLSGYTPGDSAWNSIWSPFSSLFSGIGSTLLYIIVIGICAFFLISCILSTLLRVR